MASPFEIKNARRWGAIIAAGGILEAKLAHLIGERIKGLAKFGGSTCIETAIQACRNAGIGTIVLVAEEDVVRRVSPLDLVRVASPGASSVQSAINGVQLIDEDAPLLFLPADLPLLKPDHVSVFISRIAERLEVVDDTWFVGGLVNKLALEAAFPSVPASFIKLREGRFVAASLFAASRQAVLQAASSFEEFAARRKSTLRLLMRLGLGNLIKYALGRVSICHAERVVGGLLGGKAIILSDLPPELAIDFDNVLDYQYLAQYFQAQET